MVGGGLFALVAYGQQNILLSGNPDFTYFYKAYKRYTHFAEESVTQPLEGPQEPSIDQPIKVRLKIQRVADLVRDMYLVVDLPDIYCKWIDLVALNGARESQVNFNWVRYIGTHLIQSVGFYIGGQKIQEFNGDYILAKAQADLPNTQFEKWRRLVGDVPELYDPARGIWAGGSAGAGYPLVYPDPANSNLNRPSIFGRQLQIPLPFWFTEDPSLALPLLALQYQECEVQVTFRPIQSLYQVLDASGNHVAPGYYQLPLNPSQPMNPAYVQTDDTCMAFGNFLVDWGAPLPLIPTWQLNPRIQVTYVYLTDDERKLFATMPLQYLVRQVTLYSFPGLVTREFAQIRTHNPINRIFIVPRRSDSLPNRNDVANFSNWPFGRAPWVAPLTPYPPFVLTSEATGQLIPVAGQASILRTLQILGDGNPLQEEKPISYFSETVPWKYLAGTPDANIAVYPFALHSPNTQPDGSINSSRIRLFQIDLNPYPLLQDTNYAYDFEVFVENLNWVNVAGGMGGLKYAL